MPRVTPQRSDEPYAPLRLAVVTGAGGGIGQAIALELARAGTSLALLDNNDGSLSETVALCQGHGVDITSWVVDVANHAAVADTAQQISSSQGAPNGLFNLAGLIHIGHLRDADIADIRRLLDVDLMGTISCCQVFLPDLMRQPSARIVNVSSAFGLVGVAGYSAYNAAKFAVRGFTEALQQEVPDRVKVSCVILGGVRTGIMRNGLYAPKTDAAAIQHQFDSRIARTSAEDAAAAILRGSTQGRQRIVVGSDAHAADLASRLVAGKYQFLTKRLGLTRP
ncbi:SDR family NAD(P)-dependent oxidoreductase [Lapillicoccus sp.]|uniref:SDR family NAD(P)-dependent oxidoreductase n=1 Tax=Lapillicoccus sp. TaxID=1909287 RepID=UPI0025E7ABCE|nr:SDR family NAD(P)-dependent oxidoreductase [Lapillicoccus sp.]